MAQHNENGVSGRDANGQLAKGNRFGPGNSLRRRVAALHREMLEAVDGDSMHEAMLALIAKAKDGDVAAAKLVLRYVLGKPTAADPVGADERKQRELKLRGRGGAGRLPSSN